MFFKKIIYLSLLCFVSAHADANDEGEKDCEFLGTLAGKQTRWKNDEKGGKTTSARAYKSHVCDDLRAAISAAGHDEMGNGYKKIGEDYSYTPLWRGNHSDSEFTGFSSRPTSMPGGGFFRTKKLQGQEAFLNCFAYVLGSYGTRLEDLAGMPMKDIQDSVKMSIDSVVRSYFECVEQPQDGDLAIYKTIKPEKTPGGASIHENTNTHAGIYRKSQPNWNSPSGGTIESKWGWLGNPYVFQHDVFFVPHFYGDVVLFYRLKRQ